MDNKRNTKNELLLLIDEVVAGCDEAWETLESRDRFFDAIDALVTYIEEA